MLRAYLLTKVEGAERDTYSTGVLTTPPGVGVDVRVDVGVGERFSDMLILELPRPALGSSSGDLGRANPSEFSECARPTAPYQQSTLETMVVRIRAVCKFSEHEQSKMRCTALTVSLLVAKTWSMVRAVEEAGDVFAGGLAAAAVAARGVGADVGVGRVPLGVGIEGVVDEDPSRAGPNGGIDVLSVQLMGALCNFARISKARPTQCWDP